MNQPGAFKINNFRKKYKSYVSIVRGKTNVESKNKIKELTKEIPKSKHKSKGKNEEQSETLN